MDPTNFEAFLAQQKARGALDSQGRFTLDHSRAKLKLAQFQFDDATAYLLKFVQAGVLLGARRIRLSCGLSTVTIRFEEPSERLGSEDVINLIRDPIESEAGRRFPILANALTGAPTSSIVFEDPFAGDRLTVAAQLAQETLPKQDPGYYQFTLTRLDKNRSAQTRAAESKTINERCDLCPVPVIIDGLIVALSRPGTHFYSTSKAAVENSQPFYLAELHQAATTGPGLGLPEVAPEPAITYIQGARAQTGFKLPGMFLLVRDSPQKRPKEPDGARLLVVLSPLFEGEGRLHLVQHGVTLEVLKLDLGCPGAVAAVCVDGLATDLSGFKVRPCQELSAAIDEARAKVAELVKLTLEELPHLGLLLTDSWHNLAGAVVGGLLGGFVGIFGGIGGGILGVMKGAAAGGSAAWAWNQTTHANAKLADRCRLILEKELRNARLTKTG